MQQCGISTREVLVETHKQAEEAPAYRLPPLFAPDLMIPHREQDKRPEHLTPLSAAILARELPRHVGGGRAHSPLLMREHRAGGPVARDDPAVGESRRVDRMASHLVVFDDRHRRCLQDSHIG